MWKQDIFGKIIHRHACHFHFNVLVRLVIPTNIHTNRFAFRSVTVCSDYKLFAQVKFYAALISIISTECADVAQMDNTPKRQRLDDSSEKTPSSTDRVIAGPTAYYTSDAPPTQLGRELNNNYTSNVYTTGTPSFQENFSPTDTLPSKENVYIRDTLSSKDNLCSVDTPFLSTWQILRSATCDTPSPLSTDTLSYPLT